MIWWRIYTKTEFLGKFSQIFRSEHDFNRLVAARKNNAFNRIEPEIVESAAGWIIRYKTEYGIDISLIDQYNLKENSFVSVGSAAKKKVCLH